MLVNRDLISRLAMTKEFALGMAKISSTNEKESLIEYSLEVKGARIGTKNFAMLKKERILNCRLQHCKILCANSCTKNFLPWRRRLIFSSKFWFNKKLLLAAFYQLTYQYLFYPQVVILCASCLTCSLLSALGWYTSCTVVLPKCRYISPIPVARLTQKGMWI